VGHSKRMWGGQIREEEIIQSWKKGWEN